MKYEVLIDFVDIPTGKAYKAGDTFECEDSTRVNFMMQPNTQRTALIKTIDAEVEETKEGIGEKEDLGV